MFPLARAKKGLANAAAFRASKPPDAATTALWTTRRSVYIRFVKHDPRPDPSPDSGKAPDLKKKAKKTKRKPFDKLPARPGVVTPIPSTRAAQRGKLAGDLTADDFEVTTPPRSKPVALKPHMCPTVVAFSMLADNTTTADVLLSIREAFTEGQLSGSEAHIIDAYMRKRRLLETSDSVIVEFKRPIGAERVFKLLETGQMKVRGIEPRAALYYIKKSRRYPTPNGEEETTLSGGSTKSDSAEETKDHDQSNTVRRTASDHDRTPSLAAEDEELLRFDAASRSVVTGKSVSKTSYAQDWDIDDAKKG